MKHAQIKTSFKCFILQAVLLGTETFKGFFERTKIVDVLVSENPELVRD